MYPVGNPSILPRTHACIHTCKCVIIKKRSHSWGSWGHVSNQSGGNSTNPVPLHSVPAIQREEVGY